MKVTATFFDQNNKGKNIESKGNIQKIFFFAICILISFVIVKNINISPKLLNFASNFRQAESNNPGLSDVFEGYALFNKSNYVLNDNSIENSDIVTAINENTNLYEVIDSVTKDIDTTAVFSNNEKSIITDETKTLQRISIGNTKILNYSSNRKINFEEIMSKNMNLTKKSDKILVYNTHTSESYSQSEKYKFEYEGVMRSRNAEYNMLAITKELTSNFSDKSINCIQDTTPHDYGTYTSAYSKSRKTIKSKLENIGGAGISIDVHRDASSNLEFRPIANVKGIQTSQLMFVMGIGTDTTKNPYYQENLALAIKIQRLADEVYPGLFRPMMIRDSVYNQDMNKYSLLVEVGATGNTIDEAKLATRCLANLLNIIYND